MIMNLWFVDLRNYLHRIGDRKSSNCLIILTKVLSLSYPLIPFITSLLSSLLQLHNGNIATHPIDIHISSTAVTPEEPIFTGS